MDKVTLGHIQQLTTQDRIEFPTLNWRPLDNPKIDVIKHLKRYKEDCYDQEIEIAFQTVIDWFINCTPEYKE